MNRNNLFSPLNRRITGLIISVFTLCGFCLLIWLNGNAKIMMLYVNLILFILLIITFKNTINKYEICTFAALCFMLMSYAPAIGEMDSLTATSYAISFRYGISSRGLIATFIDLITNGQFINTNFVWHFIFSSTIIISFIISVYIGYIINTAKDKNKLFVYLSSLIYISCFTSVSAYYVEANYGRVEIFALLFMLIFILIIEKQKIRWLIPILALFTVFTHLILVFFYIPFIGIIFLYQLIEKKDTRKSTICLFITTVCTVLLGFTLYILFRSNTFMFESSGEFFNYLTGKTNLEITEDWLKFTMYGGLDLHLDGWKHRMSSNTGPLLLCIIINIPLLFLFILFWIQCIKESLNKTAKFIFSLPLLIIPFHAIAFFMFFDYGRWMIMILTIQFMFLFYFMYQQNSIIMNVISKTYSFLNKWKYVIIMICFVMICLGPINHTNVSSRSIRIINLFLSVLGIKI